MRGQGRLADALRGLVFAVASKVRPGAPRHSRQMRFLIKAINHDLLYRLAGIRAARDAYVGAEGMLSHDFHYWLQRGSLEVEHGDIRQAELFLNQARGLEPDDPWVLNEWAY